jgi:hypothetical protein
MQAGVRSTAHRRGITANPCWPAGLRTISIVLRRIWLAHSNRRPANPPSAKKNRTRGTQGGMQQDRFRTVAVLGGSGQHDHNQEQAEGVGDDEPLPAVDLLAGVVPTTVPADGVGALHTLRIDQPGAGLRIATLLYPQLAPPLTDRHDIGLYGMPGGHPLSPLQARWPRRSGQEWHPRGYC